jgi:hypothetical protein
MSKYRWLLFLLAIVWLWYWLGIVKENYNAVPYNSFEVPKNKQDSLYDAETKRIDEIFSLVNRDVLPDYKDSYTKYPNSFRFVYNDTLKTFLLKQITSTLKSTSYYNDSKFTIVRDLYNLYWRDIENKRHFIFNLDLNDSIKAFTRKFKVYLVVNRINNYLTDNGEYIPTLPFKSDDIEIKYIGTDNVLTYFTVLPQTDQLLQEPDLNRFYRTQNNLYLLEPFLTNGRQMRITDAMQMKFDQALKQRRNNDQESRERDKGGFCFNSTAATANTKAQCIDAGGIWDFPPSDDMECPFLNANQNYPNNFGGIKGEKCELPRNMQIIGYRNYSYSPDFLPLCYNCRNKRIDQGSLGYCCDEQNNKTVYPQLITPDYAYVGDTALRKKYSDIFTVRNLSID